MRGKAAFTLVEIMFSVLILSIVMIGGAFYFLHSSSQIRISRRSRMALELAEERIERLKAVGFSGLANEMESGLPLGGLPATRQTEIIGIDEDGDGREDYRRIIVTVFWEEGTASQEVSLTTLISPR